MTTTESDDDKDLPDITRTTNIPPTIYVIKFHPNAKKECVEWLLEKIEAKQKYGGAELFVRCEPQKPGQGVTIHVSATKIKLLEIAEALEIKKKNSNGLMQEFCVKDLDKFLYNGVELDTILTSSEREYCVRMELENIIPKHDETYVKGYPQIKLFSGKSIIKTFLEENLITSLFPLHEVSYLNLFQNYHQLTSLINGFPLQDIRDYFGENISYNLGFCSFYTTALLVPMILRICHFFKPTSNQTSAEKNSDIFLDNAIFAAFNIVWVIVILEAWKRRSCELSYWWGTLGLRNSSLLRTHFESTNKPTNLEQFKNGSTTLWKTNFKILCSATVVFISCLISIFNLLVFLLIDQLILDFRNRPHGTPLIYFSVPAAIYTLIVCGMNEAFKNVAVRLTEWEEHDCEEQYQWHKMAKIVSFVLVNSFGSLFYSAFCSQNMDTLAVHVGTQLIVTLLFSHFEESYLPLAVRIFIQEVKSKITFEWEKLNFVQNFLMKSKTIVDTESEKYQQIPVLSLDLKDPRISQARNEIQMQDFSEKLEDYTDLVIQFGYVFMFSAVYPMAPFLAFISNIFKLSKNTQILFMQSKRPKTKKISTLNIWMNAFEVIGVLSIATNCGLMCLSPSLKPLSATSSTLTWVFLFVGLEHLVLGFRVLFNHIFSDKPRWIREAIDKTENVAKIAAQAERGKKTRRHLSRRFRSVHGMPRSGSRSRGSIPMAQNGAISRNYSSHH